MSDWLLIVSGDELVEELRNAPENVLSMEAAMADVRLLRMSISYNITVMTLQTDSAERLYPRPSSERGYLSYRRYSLVNEPEPRCSVT